MEHILKVEQQVQTKTLNFYKDLFRRESPPQLSPQALISQATNEAILETIPSKQQTPVILQPIDVNGFYKVTGPQEVTFYATTNAFTASQLSVGWSAVGITGISGQLQISGFSNTLKSFGSVQTGERSSESYLWFFTIQSDTDQSIEGVQNATGAILYPPGQFQFVAKKVKAPLYGKYQVNSEVVNFYFAVPPPQNTAPGWIIENLPGINAPLRVVSYSPNIETYSQKYTGKTANQATYTEGNNVYESLAILEIVDGSAPPVINAPVYVHGYPASIRESDYSSKFVPGYFNFTTKVSGTKTKVILNQNIKTGNSASLRDLNEGLPLDPPPVQMYIDEKNRGFSQGSVLALNAIGPQEDYLVSNDYANSQFSSFFKQYSNFVQFQRVTPFPPASPSYQGNTVQIELRPTELGHLISNMYLHVKMPAIKGYTYSEHIGRALIKQIDLLVNETVIETLYDDWYIIRDQLFLDADEQTGVLSAVNVQPNISAPIIGSGGGTVVTNATANTVHTFTTSTSFTLNTASTVNLLVVGGGGAGSSGIYQYTNSANVYYSPASPASLTIPLSSLAGAVVGSNTLVTSTTWSAAPTWSNISSVSTTGVTLNLGTAPTFASFATEASTITVGSNVFAGTTVPLSGVNPTTTPPITVSPAASSALVGLPATFVSQNVRFNGTVSAGDSTTLTISPITGIQWIILPSGVNLTIYNGNGGGGGGVFNQSVFLLPGSYSVIVGAGGTQASPNGGSSSFGTKYISTGGQGGAYGGASGTAYTSNAQFIYSLNASLNTAYASGGGARGGANVTTGIGESAFTTSGTLGHGGIGASYSNAVTFTAEYYGGGGGGSSNTSISGTLVTPGGAGGGGAGSSNITGYSSNTAANSGTVNTGGGGGGAFGTNPGNGGSGVVVLWYSASANTIPSSEIITPLEFFFCRRHSANNKARERLRRPYLPLCAMWNQRLYVRFTFHPNVWWCNAPNGSQMDIYDPSTTNLPTLITEEILVNDDERLYYMNTPLKYLVPRVQRESTLAFSGNNPTLQLTASFPVQTIAWFFRNKNYELLNDGRYSDSRYSYGYTTQYIATGIQLNFPSGVSNFVDVINTAKITLNNIDILSTFQGSLYYSFKQPIEHGLSIPSKNIYTYSFGLTPKEYNQGGYLNFSKLNSQTTNLQLVFSPQYTSQITQGYNLYLFYYGYTLLVFQGGFATIPFQ